MTNSREPWLWRRPARKWLLGIPLGAVIAFALGAMGLGTFNWMIHETSTNDFCYTCHSHELFIQPGYEASSHFKNAAGVEASCGACHIPHGWWGTVGLKMRASLDILPELTGRLGTEEKFESHRREMAISVWSDYLERDSSYCKTCHALDSMDLDSQDVGASFMHAESRDSGESCIECHQGIVHKLPAEWQDAWKEASGT
jgi:cytochrome c-type protein NapC